MSSVKLNVEELRRLERVHVRAWPARETASIEGWLWRYSGGGSQRANSVSTVDFHGADVEAALDEVEARYREKGAPARLHSYSAGSPANLGEILEARGYRQGETTLTMAKRIRLPPQGPNVELSPTATADWLETYLGAVTENRRAANAMILERVPEPRCFLTFRDGGRAVSTALCVAEPVPSGGFAVIECVATREQERRKGGARAVLAGIEAYAAGRNVGVIGLQVSQTNPAAIALYASLGFVTVDENRFWMRD
jgi:ribosomal protein S18 acetylase RimI-like enzyme